MSPTQNLHKVPLLPTKKMSLKQISAKYMFICKCQGTETGCRNEPFYPKRWRKTAASEPGQQSPLEARSGGARSSEVLAMGREGGAAVHCGGETQTVSQRRGHGWHCPHSQRRGLRVRGEQRWPWQVALCPLLFLFPHLLLKGPGNPHREFYLLQEPCHSDSVGVSDKDLWIWHQTLKFLEQRHPEVVS